MPFADKSGLITGLLQQLWKGLLAAVKGHPVINLSIFMRMLARQQGSPTGSTDGVAHKAVGKFYAFIGNAIHIGCLYKPIIIGTQRLIGMIIGHNPDNIRPILFCASLLLR